MGLDLVVIPCRLVGVWIGCVFMKINDFIFSLGVTL